MGKEEEKRRRNEIEGRGGNLFSSVSSSKIPPKSSPILSSSSLSLSPFSILFALFFDFVVVFSVNGRIIIIIGGRRMLRGF